MSLLVTEVAAGAVRGGTSILYAGLGESLSERSGVVNLGMEGCLLVGALAAYAATAKFGNVWIGAAAGALAGGALAAVHAWFVISRKANQLATGLVVLFLALGLTSMFGAGYVQAIVKPFKTVRLPLLADIPFVGPTLFRHDPLVYLSMAAVPALWWIIHRSRWGVVLRATGERPSVVETYGHRVETIRYIAVIGGGMLAGIGGAHLSIAYTLAWFENMAQGRGFIAVAVVMFAARHPVKVAGGSYLFGGALALAPALQARGFAINQFALDALPYVLILVVLIVLGRKRAAESPEGLAAVFELGAT
jgi:general nucleoside transport system permease protein